MKKLAGKKSLEQLKQHQLGKYQISKIKGGTGDTTDDTTDDTTNDIVIVDIIAS